ncbi:MAG: hypothetical protein R3F55_00360 [Alphaproteobacteria bacterium]
MWLTRSELKRRQALYRRVFDGPDGEAVLADLARFCRAFATTFVRGDPHASALGEGRREVFNRIAALIALDEDGYARLMARLLREEE